MPIGFSVEEVTVIPKHVKNLVVTLLIITGYTGFAQVKHNFNMAPEKTDCHEIPEKLVSKDSAISIIRESAFRFKQDIRISQYQSPNSAEYFSCDGTSGYMIVIENENEGKLYLDVPKRLWDSFINSKDPITFYADSVKAMLKPAF